MKELLWVMRVFWPMVTVAAWIVSITSTELVAVVYSVHTLLWAYLSIWWWSEYRDMEAEMTEDPIPKAPAFRGAVCTACREAYLPLGLEECTKYHGPRPCEVCGEPTKNGCVSSDVSLAALLRLKLKDALEAWRLVPPHDLVLLCPACGKQHLDIGEFETRVHRKHLCDNTPEGKTGCGHLWVPFPYATRGVSGLPLTERLPPEWAGKKFDEAIKRACAEPSLTAALVWIAIWENDRAVAQALKGERDPITGKLWDTNFYYCFRRVIAAYPDEPDETIVGRLREFVMSDRALCGVSCAHLTPRECAELLALIDERAAP